ncbi:MAG: phosphatase PAP2 family protein [Chlamydiales bacterium]|nr:phosphatase PAP2 family protein [Chlamydiales bacterium]
MLKKQWKWICPFAFLAVLAPFTPWLDLKAASLFYDGAKFYNSSFFKFMYTYGERFGFLLAFTALGVFFISYISEKWRKWRPAASALLLTVILGAGVITNILFKGFWGRPRPKQIVEFGGDQQYRPFWSPNFGGVEGDHHKSFPSGHSAIGFYYLSLILVGRRYKNRAITYTGVGLTSFWGSGLMVTRVVQGGHFFSDVVVSPVIMWTVALAVDHYVFSHRRGAAELETL